MNICPNNHLSDRFTSDKITIYLSKQQKRDSALAGSRFWHFKQKHYDKNDMKQGKGKKE
jgi:hypothetical protein